MSICHPVSLCSLCRASMATKLRLLLTTATLAAFSPAQAQTVLPSNAKPTCTVEIAKWFTSGMVTPNGGVEPADSIAFPNEENCGFYKWSEQMFLWLTSPAPSTYGGGSHVFNSPLFYNVSPADQTTGLRTLTVNRPGGTVMDFSPRISQLGPNQKPVAFDQTGKMFNVIRPELSLAARPVIRNGANVIRPELGPAARPVIRNGENVIRPEPGPAARPVIRNAADQPVAFERLRVGPGNQPVFLDKAGKTIDFKAAQNGTPVLRDLSGRTLNLRLSKTRWHGKLFFIDQFGNAVPTEQGQADGNVLMAQNGSLVYYALQVNDVYAYFLTGQKNGAISATHFPKNADELDPIKTFGDDHSRTFPNANVLAMELKSAWIETTGLDASKYVTMIGTIPTYAKVSPTQWNVTGSRPAQLALVGMHVVGSVRGHPEMIWATFEHVNNTRNTQYIYTNNAGVTVRVPQNNGGSWTFSRTPPAAPANQNQPLLSLNGASIVAASPPTPIGPSDIIRVNPWGLPGDVNPATNTDIISINNSVIRQLASGDVRKNYIMTGSTWSGKGDPPIDSNTAGTGQMANSTMETFYQPSNCFSCHRGNMLGVMAGPVSGGLSHIYGTIKPLFP